jgi:dephospho-CoA kinase
MTLVLGLTGSIATGKSTVSNMFAAQGVPIFASDDYVHALYRGAAVAPVDAAFPGVARDGVIDRAELGKRILGHPELIRQVEAIVHPLVRQGSQDFVAEHRRKGTPLVVLDVPLLFESPFDYGCDAVAVTVCDEDIQRQRALARPGMTVEKLGQILARQMPQEEKKRRATYLIDTSVSIEATQAAVEALVRQLDAAQKAAEV